MDSVWNVLEQRRRSGSKPEQRSDDYRVALAIEGGGMRAAISAGMTLALYRSGLLDAFDDIYGASAGAINGTWLLSAKPEDIIGWTDPRWAKQMIGLHNLVSRRPFVDVSRLIDDIYVRQHPLDYSSVLANPITLHPMATRVSDGASVDLRPLITSIEDLRRAICASCALPIAAGGPVTLAGERYADAGVSEPISISTAAAQGATHTLVLRTRDRDYARPPASTGIRRTITHSALKVTGYSTAVAQVLQVRPDRSALDQRLLEDGWLQGSAGRVELAAVWPSADVVQPSRTEHDGARLRAAFEGGYAAFEHIAERVQS